ncbi:MAG: hypothetical protein WEA61_03250 [Anaerolineales bacterium]
MNAQLFAALFVLLAAAVMAMPLLTPRAWAAIRVRVQRRKR